MSGDVRQLRVWQRAMELCEAVYRQTRQFPAEERFGLTWQMKRAAISIPCNVAEGYGRGTTRDCRQFILVARGSALELETQIMLSLRLGFLNGDTANELITQVREIIRMLTGLIRSLDKTKGNN